MTKDSKTLRESEILLRMDIATILAAHKVAPHPESKPIQEILPDLLERITRYKDACIESEIALAKKEKVIMVYKPGSVLEPGVDYITIKVEDFEAAKKEAYEEVIEAVDAYLTAGKKYVADEAFLSFLRSKFLSESPKEV